MSQPRPPTVFISYSHDSPEHQALVLGLADRLRQDGVDAMIDQYAPAPPDGWPIWMDLEIQKADFVLLVCTETYLRRVERREQPGKGRGVLWEAKLIYNLLYEADTEVQRFIPILLEGGATSHIPTPLRGTAHYQVSTPQGYEDVYRHVTGQPRYQKRELGRLKSLPALEPQSYPASLEVRAEQKPPTSLDQRNRLQMLKRVRLDWIDGVLQQSLYKIARIELGLDANPDAIERPLNAIVQVADQSLRELPPGMTISKVFDDHGGALLILGAPGTGKTTLLLELAQELLDRAEQDESHPIPVVFNLSSWAVGRKRLAQWLVAELNERSDVPKRLAQRWVETEQIIPLLDGLDEVVLDHRQGCVEAINNFRRDYGLVPIAVCSRIADYEALSTKLRLRNAVLVQPLTRPQVQAYLERTGGPLQTLGAALGDDPSLWELLETPLMLWVALLAYQNAPVEFSREDTLDQRRRRLFDNFVDAMFRRRSAEVRYTRKQALQWLSWLASTMTRNNQTVFYLEDLHVGWLPTRAQKWLSGAGIVVAIGLSLGLIGLIFGGHVSVGLILGLIGGLIGAFISSVMELRPVETLRLGLADLPSRTHRAIRSGLSAGLISGLISGLIGGPLIGLGIPGNPGLTTPRLNAALQAGQLIGLYFGLSVGLIFGLLALISTEAVETRRSSNQGTRSSIRMALGAVLILGLIGGLSIGLIDLPFARPSRTLSDRLNRVLGYWLWFGLIGGLAFGGLFAVRHFVLRLVLWLNRSAPLNYVRFLDYAATRLFLRKVGGGYIFPHRMLMDYFASLHPAERG